LKNQLDETIKQYENRIQKFQTQFDTSERQIKELKDLNKTLNKSNDFKQNEFNSLITSLIEESSEIRERSLLYLNIESDDSTKNEAMNKMKFLLAKLQKISFQHDLSILNDLKTHILLLHQTLYDSMKQLGTAQTESLQLDKAWKRSFENLANELEKEKKKTNKI